MSFTRRLGQDGEVTCKSAMKPCESSKEMDRVLRPGRHCVLVLGDIERDGKSRRTTELIGELAESVTESRLRVLQLVRDEIPDIRRSRRRTRTTKVEKILVLKKRADSIQTVDRESIAVCDRPPRKPEPTGKRGSR